MHSLRYLRAECLVVFVSLPPMLAFFKPHGMIYPLLWVAMAFACRSIELSHGWKFLADWNFKALTRAHLYRIFRRFLPLAGALLLFAMLMIPERLFSLPLSRPWMWVAVMFLYPVLSVVPQELLFRSFFLRRYDRILQPPALLAASACAFGWVHIILMNWVAVVFAGVGGWLFADTYRRTHSLAAACFEHALYGCWIFTIGMGFYFYHGAAVH